MRFRYREGSDGRKARDENSARLGLLLAVREHPRHNPSSALSPRAFRAGISGLRQYPASWIWRSDAPRLVKSLAIPTLAEWVVGDQSLVA